MSHIVEIQTEVRDAEAVQAACRRLGLPAAVFGEARLFSDRMTGWQVQLPGWRYPVVCDVTTGKLDFDNYNGRWGKQEQIQKFLQSYAVEKAKIESRKRGHACTEQQLEDGSVKLTIQVGGAV